MTKKASGKAKKISSGLLGAVKSGEFLDNIKHSFEAFKGGDRKVLPKDFQDKVNNLESSIDQALTAHEKLGAELLALKRLLSVVCYDAVTLCKGEVSQEKTVSTKSSQEQRDEISVADDNKEQPESDQADEKTKEG